MSRQTDACFHRTLAREIGGMRGMVAAGRRPGPLSFYPCLSTVLRAAVRHAKRNRCPGWTTPFRYRGQEFQYSITTLGRVVLLDREGKPLAGTGYLNTWGKS